MEYRQKSNGLSIVTKYSQIILDSNWRCSVEYSVDELQFIQIVQCRVSAHFPPTLEYFHQQISRYVADYQTGNDPFLIESVPQSAHWPVDTQSYDYFPGGRFENSKSF